ncbi:autism susceptibility gene 2 protein isoform X1 [Oncorhynchus tshawytscha]|uniref:Autism susceptibility gene 2 protein-like n=1 Tax=Oncorhynchus tshawytscha TaxID=74940 RepID=A0A8C8I8Q3_ONCTS|nr:autism susceptibility gene 2 protein isoform X1 [Oncorhynchus tshawytscha]
MEGPIRSSVFRHSRRSRSQRDRERRRRRVDLAVQRATSPSSGSERELCESGSVLGPGGKESRTSPRHRPPRRRKRVSVSCEEDIIDGFSIASFISIEALEMDCSMKPNQRAAMLMGRGSKRKRGPKENGRGLVSEPEEGALPSFSRSCCNRNRKKRRKTEVKVGSILFLETGYICDTESESADKASDNDMEPMFTVSTRKVMEPIPVSVASSMGKGCPLLPLPGRCGLSRLAVTPRVSGLERSQERSLELPYPEPLSTSFSCLPSLSPATVTRPGQLNGGSSNGLHHHDPSPPRSKHKPFLTFPGRHPSIYSMGINNRNGTSVKPQSSSAASSLSSMRPPTPSTGLSMSLMRGPGSSGSLRPPSRSGSLFTSSPGLPPPPPLLTSHSGAEQDLLRQGLNSHFLASQDREGRRSVPGAESNGGGPGRSTPGGPSGASSSSGSSGRSSQASVQPLAFQFHQHNHQHQHTHTHQHFTPFLHPNTSAPPPQHLFEKYGKMEGLYRNTFFPQYPAPSAPGIQPVLPPTGPFSSLQGAFQPKPLAPQRTSPEMTARLGGVPHHLQPKDPRLTDPFGTSLKVSNKPGKWCAMHVRVAWMILSHQKKVKLMQADPHKLDFRNELLARLPGAGGLGPLGPLGGGLPSAHDLNRPASLFTAAGGVNPSSPFIPPSTPHSSFLTPTAHLDPYGRSPPFAPLGALGSGAFGGLGSPTLANSSVFGHKEPPVVGSLPNPHDPWNRLHNGPPPFAGPSWAKGSEKRDERDQGKDMERREIIHIKDEKDRDNMLYGRQPVRMSPVSPALKLQQHRSSTPVSHINGHGGPLGGPSGLTEDLTRSHSRDRDGDKRPVSSRPPPPGPSSSAAAADRDRPRSSSSSVLTTPPPSGPGAPSPLDLYPRQQPPAQHGLHNELPHSSQREGGPPALSSATVTSLCQGKKPDRTTTPLPKPPPLFPPVKVKEERKEEPEPVPISLPPSLPPSHNYDRPNSRPHHHRSATPSSRSLTPTPSLPLPPPTPHNPHHHLSILERSRAQAAIEAYLGSTQGAGGIVVGPGGERFSTHPHGLPQGHGQHPHSFPWDPWRELAAQQQQQQRREAMALRSDPHLALRSDPHLARLLQNQHAQRFLEAERAAAMAAAVAANNPHHHPPTSSASSARQEFGLMAHNFDRPPQLGPQGGGLMDEQQRAQILREDFERARYFGMHSHPHLSGSHLPPGSHSAHLEQLHAGMLSHSHLHQPGASTHSPHHPGLYSRLGPLHAHHVPNGILAKTPAGLVGALSVGAPPPLIPSVTNRSSTPTRRLGGPGDLAMYSHKDSESR